MNDNLDVLQKRLNTSKRRLKVKEYAEKNSMNPRTVYKYISRGFIPAIRIGNLIRIESDDE